MLVGWEGGTGVSGSGLTTLLALAESLRGVFWIIACVCLLLSPPSTGIVV